MEKLKVPIIILLSVILIVLFSQYQNIVEENSVLKLKLSERLVVLKNTPESIITIDDNCPEKSQSNPIINKEVTNVSIENGSVVTNEASITEIETTQDNRNAKTVPFEYQEVDYEWATLLETAVSDVFQTSELLEKFTLEHVECRSSVCEVRMPKGQDDTFHQSVLVLFALEEMGIKHHSLTLSPDAEEGTVVFYFSKHETE